MQEAQAAHRAEKQEILTEEAKAATEVQVTMVAVEEEAVIMAVEEARCVLVVVAQEEAAVVQP